MKKTPKTGYQSKKNSWISVASIGASVRVGPAEYKSTSVQGTLPLKPIAQAGAAGSGPAPRIRA